MSYTRVRRVDKGGAGVYRPVFLRDPSTGWIIVYCTSGAPHVIPIDELAQHHMIDCPCGTHDDEGITVHTSLEGRELFERGERKRS